MLTLGLISETFISIGIWIVSGIYHVAAWAFELFLILASGELVDAEQYETIVTNFYIVIGVVLLFFLAFAILRGMVNPDDQKKGTQAAKKVVINLVTSGIILAVLPTIFAFAFDLQDSIILNQNTIGRFFNYGSLDNGTSTGSAIDTVKTGAFQIVDGVFTAFFNVNNDSCNEIIADAQARGDSEALSLGNASERLQYCQGKINSDDKKSFHGESAKTHTFAETMAYVEEEGDFGIYSTFSKSADNGKIDFNFLLILVGGCLLIYVAVSYCFDMAIRLIKLVFYQLIAPIPIFMRVVPDGKLSDMFSKWLKVTGTCYLEVYVRIFVFYFCLFLCKAMMTSNFLSYEVYTYGVFIGLFAQAFVYMGIIMFMRQAPKLFSEVTGLDSGNMKLGIRDKLAQGGLFTAGAVAGAGLTTLVRNGVNAGQNVRNKYKEYKDNGVKYAGLRTAGNVVKGIASTATGTISASARGLKAGFGAKSAKDMTSAASKGAQEVRESMNKRATYKASHGNSMVGTMKGHVSDMLETGAQWAGIELDYSALQSERTSSDAMLKSVSNIKSVSEDYLKKHKHEFYVGLSDNELHEIERYRQDFENAKKANDVVAQRKAQSQIDAFENRLDSSGKTYKSKRLDIMEQTIDAIKMRGKAQNQTDSQFAAEIADAQNAYNKGFKDLTDNFAYIANEHVGAEKERLSIEAEFNIINDKLKENSKAMVAKTLREGDPNHIVSPVTDQNITFDNSKEFLKQLKSSAEVTNSEINRQYEKMQRKNSGKNGNK